MKKIIALTMVLAMLLCGCGKEETPETTAAPVTEATAAPTTEPTTVPTTEPVPVYVNPLTGEEIEEPLTNRIFGFSIGNTKEALPHYGVSKADLLFESFVNGLTTRRFAMYSNVQDVTAIGGIRSMRVQWTDLCQAYDAVGVHAAGSGYVLGDMHENGIDNIYGEQWDGDFHYRDKERMRTGTSMEHVLYDRGADIVPFAESQGIRVTQDAEKDYGMHFAEIPSSENGEAADIVNITFILSGREKPTTMTYHKNTGSYSMNQYGVEMVDGIYNNTPELFKNVFALEFNYHGEYNVYHVPETVGDGTGFFACDGKIIPIQWHRADANSPFTFTLEDGTPLQQGVGNSYIAMIPTGSTVTWEAAETEDAVLPEQPAAEAAETGAEAEPETQAAAPVVETEAVPAAETEAAAPVMETEAVPAAETVQQTEEPREAPEMPAGAGDGPVAG